MKIGGCSVQGSYHDKNQDSFLTADLDFGKLIVLSDGVGSCMMSEKGSYYACQSLKKAIEYYGGIPNNTSGFFDHVYQMWCECIKNDGLRICDCYATLLFCFVSKRRIFVARLGDGVIAVKYDDQYMISFDDKSDHAVNETDCFDENFSFEYVHTDEMMYSKIEGIILCSDGVAVSSPEKYKDFLDDIINEYADIPLNDIENDMKSWLAEWSGCDDKTIAFCLEDSEKDDK